MVGVLLGRVGGRVSGTGGERAIASKNAAARLRLPLAFAGWSPRSLCVSVFVLFACSNAVKDSVLVGGGCFAHVDCAALGATGALCNAGRPWSGRLLAQGLRIVRTSDSARSTSTISSSVICQFSSRAWKEARGMAGIAGGIQ